MNIDPNRREDDYFMQKEQELRAQLRAKANAQAAALQNKQKLSEATNIDDQAILDRLHALGLDDEQVKVLHLLPLVEVAWADGVVHPKERLEVLEAAEMHGAGLGSAGCAYLAALLEERPDAAYFAEVRDIVKTILHAKGIHPRSVVELCTQVAAAAGGFLGLGNKIDGSEQQLLEHLDAFLQGHDTEVKGLLEG